jgi:hypothetical protein
VFSWCSFRKFDPLLKRSAGAGSELLRLGYRIAGGSADLVALEVPLSVVREAIARDISTRVTQTGTVSVSSVFDDSGSKAGSCEISLVHLIEATLDPHGMHMEETTAAELAVLSESLEHSVKFVRVAIARLSNGQLDFPREASNAARL